MYGSPAESGTLNPGENIMCCEMVPNTAWKFNLVETSTGTDVLFLIKKVAWWRYPFIAPTLIARLVNPKKVRVTESAFLSSVDLSQKHRPPTSNASPPTTASRIFFRDVPCTGLLVCTELNSLDGDSLSLPGGRVNWFLQNWSSRTQFK
jgi:hypothetical protein